jgi:hypothetical protein
MLMPCGYLERTRLIRLLRQLEISTCSRAGARADLRDRRRTVFPRDIDRGYNRVCRNGPRSRPSQPIAETFVQLPKTGNIAKAVPVKFVVSKNSRGGLQTSNLKPQLLQKSGLRPSILEPKATPTQLLVLKFQTFLASHQPYEDSRL